MREIKLKYPLIAFLYAYLVQIDLSLDRSRWDSLFALREYYKSRISPKRVAEFLMQKFDLSSNRIQHPYFIEESGTVKKMKDSLIGFFKSEVFLSENDIYYCCQKLIILDEFLEINVEINKLEIEKLRQEFVKLTYGVIKFKLTLGDRLRVSKIEHYLQSENVEVLSADEFRIGLDI